MSTQETIAEQKQKSVPVGPELTGHPGRGIIFSAPMVRALLDGRKTQTRRLLNPQPHKWEPCVIDITEPFFCDEEHAWGQVETIWNRCSAMWEPEREEFRPLRLPFAVGDRLYIRESWQDFCPLWDGAWCGHGTSEGIISNHRPVYRADPPEQWLRGIGEKQRAPRRWRSPIHMPRWASRLTLTVTDVRVQRLCEISEEDAIAEGITLQHKSSSPVIAYETLWNLLHTKPGERWDDDPWVVAVSFSVEHGNIDRLPSLPSGRG